ncbi:ferritin-like domain-containing protein [Acetobacteraceae bacterium]|nr:ferritin-like domain-containing protein [Acetobacteraceae bacterium]QCE33020.1 ferritin-like domain-containing protein [Acetobacteraceae bacterium]
MSDLKMEKGIFSKEEYGTFNHSNEEISRKRLEALCKNYPPPSTNSKLSVEEADYRARHWQSPKTGKIEIGSDTHKKAIADMFRETFNPYKPSIIAWPELDAESLAKVTSLPIWDIAVHTEGRARLRMAAYAELLEDPDLQDAIARNAWEEDRHKTVLADMVTYYGIKLGIEPPYEMPKDAEWTYLVTGFSECWDSFFAFGLFETAKDSGLFPFALTEVFEPVMQEETRHILLFANWIAYHRKHLSLSARLKFEIKVLGVLFYLFYERLSLVRTLDEDGEEHTEDFNFTVRGAESVTDKKFDFIKFMRLCLSENERRFAGYDKRLLRPKLAPWAAKRAIEAVSTWKQLKWEVTSLFPKAKNA